MAHLQLLHGHFEDGFSKRNAPEVEVADNWDPWYDPNLVRPEFRRETTTTGRGRVHMGHAAQKWFTLHARHDAGIWQRVQAQVGQWYALRGWVYPWSSEEDDPDTSIRPGKLRAMLGINPWGHWPQHYATIWGKEVGQDQYNQWVQIEVIAQAWHTEISVCARSFNEWPAKHNDIYLDDMTLAPFSLPIEEPNQPPETPGGPTEIDYDLIATMTSVRTISLLHQSLTPPTLAQNKTDQDPDR
jgi:hypothetical protein